MFVCNEELKGGMQGYSLCLQSSNCSRSDVNVRAYLLRNNCSRNFSSIRSGSLRSTDTLFYLTSQSESPCLIVVINPIIDKL